MKKWKNRTALFLVFAITFFTAGCGKKEESSQQSLKKSSPPQRTTQESATRSTVDITEGEVPRTSPRATEAQAKDAPPPQRQESSGDLKVIIKGVPGGEANTPEGLLVESDHLMQLADGTKIQQYQIWNHRRETINKLEATINLYDDKGNKVGTVRKKNDTLEPGWCWAFTIEAGKEVDSTKVEKLNFAVSIK
jgi:hypothetical protein